MDMIDKYLEELDQAYVAGDVEKIREINDKILKEGSSESGEKVNEEYDREFIREMDGKALCKNMKRVMEGTAERLEVVKMLSSLITHLVIECQKKEREMGEYPIRKALGYLEEEVKWGSMDKGEVSEFIRERYGRFIC